MPALPTILLSFDVEEFDMPLEYGMNIPVAEQMAVGKAGLDALNALLAQHPGVVSTWFTTAHFAQHFPEDIKAASLHHEIASHTFYHTHFEESHLLQSRQALEDITGQPVTGLRMPRMRPVPMKAVLEAGYHYDSSINPCWLPGRYDNRHLPRTPYLDGPMLRLPAAVSPGLRIPLFWLGFKNYPLWLFEKLLWQCLRKDGFACLYFHPWEFTELGAYHKMPAYTRKPCGPALVQRLNNLLLRLQGRVQYQTIASFLQQHHAQVNPHFV